MSLRSLITDLKGNVKKAFSGVDTNDSLVNKFARSKAMDNMASWQQLLSDPKSKIQFGQDLRYNPQDSRIKKAYTVANNVAKNAVESMVTMVPKVGYDIGQLGKGIATGNTNDIRFSSAPARFGEDIGTYLAKDENGKSIRKPFDTVGYYKGQGKWNVPFTQIKLPELGLTESSAFNTTKKGLQAFEAPLAAYGLSNPAKMLGMLGFGSGIGGLVNFASSGAKKGSFEEGAWKTAYGMAPTLAKSSGLLGATDKYTAMGSLPVKSVVNVLQGIAYDQVSGAETTGDSIFIDALYPVASSISSKVFSSFGDAVKNVQGKILESLGKKLRKSDGTYTTLAKWVKNTRPYRKGGMGAFYGFEFNQDENGKWKVNFNSDKALLGIAIMAGGTKAINSVDSKFLGGLGDGAKPKGSDLEDILKAEEIKLGKGGQDIQSTKAEVPQEIQIKDQPRPQSGQLTSEPQIEQPILNPKTQEVVSNQSTYTDTIPQDVKNRGFVESVQSSGEVTKPTKAKVGSTYTIKHNDELMGEAKALLEDGASIDFKNTKNLDQKIAATIEQARILDAQGDHEAAANLFNNLSEHGTELGRAVNAFNLLDKMSPEAISLSAAGKIKKYNITAKKPIPELTGVQQKQISDAVEQIRNMPEGRDRNIAIFELNNKINSFIPSSFADKFITTWKAGLLTSLRTHERNLLGNTIMLGSEISSKPIASVADQLMSLRTGQRTITPTTKGIGEMVSNKTMQQTSDLVKMGYDPTKEIEKFEVKKINWGNNPIERTLKAITDKVFNTLSAEDRSFYNTAFANSLYDQARANAINAGKSGDATYIKELFNNPTEEMLTTATKDANYATFHDKSTLSNWATGFKKTLGKTEKGKIISEVLMPFTGVPSSIVGKTVAYSPIGLVKGVADMGQVVIKNMPDLQRQAAQEVARGTMGTALFSIGAYLMSKGLMTGQPKDEKERNQWQLEGKQANSVLINGKWRNINSVGPQSLILLAGGKYYQETNNPDGSVASYAFDLGKDQLNQTFLQGMMGPLNAITDPQRYGKSWVGNTASSLVPNFIKDVAKATDPVARETNNWWEYPMSGIPGLRNTLLPKRDVLGNEIPQEPTGFSAFYDLFNSKTPISNTVVDELARLNNEGSNATPSTLQKTQTINKVKMKLTPQELDMLEQKVGEQLNPALEKLINSRSYQLLSDDKKVKAIDNLVDDIRKGVKKEVGVLGMPDTGYKSSADAPKTLTDKLSLYGKAALEDPKKTVKAIVSGQPIRKVVGDSVILERQNDLAILDSGNKETVVDHIIPLSLGGTNDKSNLQNITTNENIAKAKVEKQILKDLKSGKINEKEAQKRVKDWKNQLDTLPDSATKEILSEMATGGKDDEEVIVYPYGNGTKTVKKTIKMPKLTSNNELNKKIISDYKSDLTDYEKYIMYQYESGAITEDKAGTELERIANIKKALTKATKSSSGSKAKKVDLAKISQKILKPVKVSSKSPKFNTFKILSDYRSTKMPEIKAPDLKVIDFKTAKLKKGTK